LNFLVFFRPNAAKKLALKLKFLGYRPKLLEFHISGPAICLYMPNKDYDSERQRKEM
jgi:hypothetical protein